MKKHFQRNLADGSPSDYSACNKYDLKNGRTLHGYAKAHVQATTNPAEVTCRKCQANFYSEEQEAAKASAQA